MPCRQLRWLYRLGSIHGGDIRRMIWCGSKGHISFRSTQVLRVGRLLLRGKKCFCLVRQGVWLYTAVRIMRIAL